MALQVCSGCRQTITTRRFLKCSLCDDLYDIECADVPEKRFYNTMTAEHKARWKCHACICKIARTNTTDTPIKSKSNYQRLHQPTDDHNLTMKVNKDKGDIFPIVHIDPPEDNDLSIDGILDNTVRSQPINSNNPATIEQISSLLDAKLNIIKTAIILDIKNTIQTEVNNAMKTFCFDVENNIESLRNKHLITQDQITAIDRKIEGIQQQLSELENSKKIVLFGLKEGQHETVNDLYHHVSQAFSDIMGINIYPYIEDIKRIGRRGANRPITIELLSKRMAKYIMENSRKFKNTGLSIDMYLDGDKLHKRNELRKQLQISRKDGQHAVIKNNKLFINGKEYTHDMTTSMEQPSSPILPTHSTKLPNAQVPPVSPQQSNQGPPVKTKGKKTPEKLTFR